VTRTTRSDIVAECIVGSGCSEVGEWMRCIEIHDEVTTLYTLVDITVYDAQMMIENMTEDVGRGGGH
jgi:hypothetical protein